jgi:hypothetical protein
LSRVCLRWVRPSFVGDGVEVPVLFVSGDAACPFEEPDGGHGLLLGGGAVEPGFVAFGVDVFGDEVPAGDDAAALGGEVVVDAGLDAGAEVFVGFSHQSTYLWNSAYLRSAWALIRSTSAWVHRPGKTRLSHFGAQWEWKRSMPMHTPRIRVTYDRTWVGPGSGVEAKPGPIAQRVGIALHG